MPTSSVQTYSIFDKARFNRENRENQFLGSDPRPVINLSDLQLNSGNAIDMYSQLQNILKPSQEQIVDYYTPKSTAIQQSNALPSLADELETQPVIGQYTISTPVDQEELFQANLANTQEIDRELANGTYRPIEVPEEQVVPRATAKNNKVASQASKRTSKSSSTSEGTNPSDITIQKNPYDWLNNLLPLLLAGGVGYMLAK